MIKGWCITLQCRKCKHLKTILLDHGLSSLNIPTFCERPKTIGQANENCPWDSYKIVPDKCKFVDFQTLKI